MKKKSFWHLSVICLVIFVVCIVGNRDVQAKTKDFAGTRTVDFMADKSDISNFINGGRPAFDLALRKSTPEWLSYKFASAGQDLRLTLSFEFDSYEDYEGKLEQLLGQKPQIVYKIDNGIYLLESFNAEALLNFIGFAMNADGSLSERQLKDIFSSVENKMILNGKEYTFEKRMNIRPDGGKAVKFDKLSVRTQIGSDSCSRSVIAEIDTKFASEDDVERAVSQFEVCGEVKKETLSETRYMLTVDFEAENMEELSQKTMTCLNAAVFFSSSEAYKDDETVKVVQTEYFDIETLLRNPTKEAVPFEDGSEMIEPSPFYYEAKYSENEFSIYSDDEAVQVSGGTIAAENMSTVTYMYEHPFTFSQAYMETKKSYPFGKITREVVFEVPITIASGYHEAVKKQLGENLSDGIVFDIYDEGMVRYYKLSYSSYFQEDIKKFALDMQNAGGMEIRDDGISMSGIRKTEKIIAICAAAVIVIIFIAVFMFKIRKFILNMKSHRNHKKETQGWFCPQCGNYNAPQHRFCSRCGHQK